VPSGIVFTAKSAARALIEDVGAFGSLVPVPARCRTFQRTRKHLPKIQSYQPFSEREGILLTALSQR
jgi:hypothetical protein